VSQLYMGKPPVSKGIGELYGGLGCRPLAPCFWERSGEFPRKSLAGRTRRYSRGCEALSRRDLSQSRDDADEEDQDATKITQSVIRSE
jgi:hypothetical protein